MLLQYVCIHAYANVQCFDSKNKCNNAYKRQFSSVGLSAMYTQITRSLTEVSRTTAYINQKKKFCLLKLHSLLLKNQLLIKATFFQMFYLLVNYFIVVGSSALNTNHHIIHCLKFTDWYHFFMYLDSDPYHLPHVTNKFMILTTCI